MELTSCLALVAPVGMTEEARREWLTVAWDTLKHLPSDVLTSGCAFARQQCDHPAKIVPAIVEATAQAMRWRQEAAGNHLALPSPPIRKHVMDRDRDTFTADDWAELSAHLEQQGSKVRYRENGERYSIEG